MPSWQTSSTPGRAGQKALADALAAIRQARQALRPPTLSGPHPRRSAPALPKMGDKSVAFVTKAAEFAQSLPTLMPQYLDVAGLVVDAGVSADLLPLYLGLNCFATDVDDTRLEAGSEGYSVGFGGVRGAANRRLAQPARRARPPWPSWSPLCRPGPAQSCPTPRLILPGLTA
ncbi:MAG: hypothetical protein WKG07_13780 [Hymenobacter sp.]